MSKGDGIRKSDSNITSASYLPVIAYPFAFSSLLDQGSGKGFGLRIRAMEFGGEFLYSSWDCSCEARNKAL